MKIAIIGMGSVGGTLGRGWAERGHNVTFGAKDAEKSAVEGGAGKAKVATVRKENEAQSKAITIMGDKDISYRLLRKVMVTCARANFSEVSFAVTPKHDA